MKCSVPRCKEEAVVPRKPRRELTPPELDLCKVHRDRYVRDYRRHFQPMLDALKKKPPQRRVVRGRKPVHAPEALVQAWASSSSAREQSWLATWLQMIDNEILNNPLSKFFGAEKGKWSDDGKTWIPEGSAAPRPSAYPGYVTKPRDPLPEHATRAGQAAIAKRAAEQDLLERRLAAEIADFQRGQRQVLELELKVKREAELRAAQKASGK